MSESRQVVFTWPKLVIGALVLLVVVAAIAFGIITVTLRHRAAAREAPSKSPEIGPDYALEAFNVNLADMDSRRYLKASISLELSSSKMVPELDKRKSQIRDIVIGVLRDQTAADLRNDSTEAAVLKSTIKERLNAVLEKGQISAVYFTEFIVQ